MWSLHECFGAGDVAASVFGAVLLHHLREDIAFDALAGDGDAGLAIDFEGLAALSTRPRRRRALR